MIFILAIIFLFWNAHLQEEAKLDSLDQRIVNSENYQQGQVNELKDRLDADEGRLDDICNTTNGNLGC